MTDHDAYRHESHTLQWAFIALMAAIGMPAIILELTGSHPEPWLGAIIFGVAILGGAFLLSWAAETAEMDISQGLALAIIAFIAVLPEYAVDFVLAWQAGADPEEAEKGLAVANMTGGNRLLIGVGWPLVFIIFFYRTRLKELVVDRQRSLELAFLAAATIYVILVPLRTTLTLIDTIVLVTMFAIYLFYTSRVESEEVELVGPARAMGSLDDWPRRATVLGVLIFAGVIIIAAAHPFTEALKDLGEDVGISEFLLIQWIAPLASESPEMLVAGLLAWRGRAAVGMGALISSKVNQWTLLIGTLPLAFMLSSGDWGLTNGLPLDHRQREEILLTAAQSAFAIAVFVNLKMGGREALALFLLFATQLVITNEQARTWYSFLYIGLCIILLTIHRSDVRSTSRLAWTILSGKKLEGHEAPPEPRAETGGAP
jgi:cation:H+ antiporter